MKISWAFVLLTLSFAPAALRSQDAPAQIPKLETPSQFADTRADLAQAVRNNPDSIAALTSYAEFLDRYGDPGAREAYGQLVAALRKSGDTARAGVVARRLLRLDLLSGDDDGARRDADTYRAVSGDTLPHRRAIRRNPRRRGGHRHRPGTLALVRPHGRHQPRRPARRRSSRRWRAMW